MTLSPNGPYGSLLLHASELIFSVLADEKVTGSCYAASGIPIIVLEMQTSIRLHQNMQVTHLGVKHVYRLNQYWLAPSPFGLSDCGISRIPDIISFIFFL